MIYECTPVLVRYGYTKHSQGTHGRQEAFWNELIVAMDFFCEWLHFFIRKARELLSDHLMHFPKT